MPQFETANNCYINYEVKEPAQVEKTENAVFIHGYSCDLEEWYGYSRLIGNNVRVIVVDLYGHGKSSGVYGPKAYEQDVENARDIVLLTKHLSLDKYFVIGHSFGGRVAGLIAAQDAESVKGAILITSTPVKGINDHHIRTFFPPVMEAIQIGTAEAMAVAWTKGNGGTAIRMDEATSLLSSHLYQFNNDKNPQEGFKAVLTPRSLIFSDTICPVLFLTGDNDFFFKDTLEELFLFSKTKPQLHSFHGYGHMFVISKLLDVAPVISSFIVANSN